MAGGSFGSQRRSDGDRNNSHDLQQTRSIYLQGEKERKDPKTSQWTKPSRMSREGRRAKKQDQHQPTRSSDSRGKKLVLNPASPARPNSQFIEDGQRSKSQSYPRSFKDKEAPGAQKEKKRRMSPESATRKHNDMAQTTRDVKNLLIQNEAFKDVDQEQISKLLTMLQNDNNREVISKVKKQSPKASKENASKPNPTWSPALPKDRKEQLKADQH